MNILNIIKNNFKLILSSICILLLVLFINESHNKSEFKNKFEISKKIADQNLAAVKDSSIQLQLTKAQLRTVDSNLYNLVVKNDSILNIKSKTITITRPIYIPVENKLLNHLLYDSITNRYGLQFISNDSVKSFNGISWLTVSNKDSIIHINPDSTDIKNFKFNFALVLSQYDDNITKYTKGKITPYYIDSMGNITNPISENLLKFDYRNIQLLDKPYELNKPIDDVNKTKYKLQTGWALTFSPLAMGVVPNNNSLHFQYVPNVGISYYVTLRKR